jgi:hypothetical protein
MDNTTSKEDGEINRRPESAKCQTETTSFRLGGIVRLRDCPIVHCGDSPIAIVHFGDRPIDLAGLVDSRKIDLGDCCMVDLGDCCIVHLGNLPYWMAFLDKPELSSTCRKPCAAPPALSSCNPVSSNLRI